MNAGIAQQLPTLQGNNFPSLDVLLGQTSLGRQPFSLGNLTLNNSLPDYSGLSTRIAELTKTPDQILADIMTRGNPLQAAEFDQYRTGALEALSDSGPAGSVGQDEPTSLWGKIDGFVDKNFDNWGDAIKTGIGSIESIGKLWNAFQMSKLAKDQFNFTRDITNTNLANQIQSYNTALEDRARSRAVAEGQTDAQRDAYIEANKARDTRKNKGG